MSNIFLDISICNNDSSGMAVATWQLLKLLSSDEEFKADPVIFTNEINKEKQDELYSLGIEPRYIVEKKYKRWIVSSFIYNYKKYIQANVLIFPFNYFPLRLKKNSKSIVILHDVLPMAIDKGELRTLIPKNRDIIKKGIDYFKNIVLCFMDKYAAHHATKVITVSEFSKMDIIKRIGISGEKVIVMPVAADGFKCDEVKREKIKQKYNLPERFILYIGGTHYRKNIGAAIKAFEKLLNDNKIPEDYRFVLFGKMQDLENILEEYDISQETQSKLSLNDHFEDEEKYYIYNLAEVSIYPSIYEGFGLPILEAMISGTAVITSNVTSMPEVAGDAALLVNPYSIEDIAEKMELMINDEELRTSYVEKGLKRSNEYTWEKSYDILKSVILDIME